mmetsp:Transcript_25858/g.59775  ORF Transcript_25858/g.59775 Transcript_25858/m.59775 type:complete len:235 (+) Transcript_25858:737-1441(+)
MGRAPPLLVEVVRRRGGSARGRIGSGGVRRSSSSDDASCHVICWAGRALLPGLLGRRVSFHVCHCAVQRYLGGSVRGRRSRSSEGARSRVICRAGHASHRLLFSPSRRLLGRRLGVARAVQRRHWGGARSCRRRRCGGGHVGTSGRAGHAPRQRLLAPRRARFHRFVRVSTARAVQQWCRGGSVRGRIHVDARVICRTGRAPLRGLLGRRVGFRVCHCAVLRYLGGSVRGRRHL